jgi:hypothetical protein
LICVVSFVIDIASRIAATATSCDGDDVLGRSRPDRRQRARCAAAARRPTNSYVAPSMTDEEERVDDDDDDDDVLVIEFDKLLR